VAVAQINLAGNGLCGGYTDSNGRVQGTYTAEGIKAIADSIAVSASITVVDLRYNIMDPESATMLATVAKEKRISLCGITPEQTEAEFSSKETGRCMLPADAILLAVDLTVRPSLTRVDVRYNALGMQDKDVLRKAVEGRSGFELLL
jgi:Ran GTPase-activating protein (RanGAP) involved in mRNA processing and transport